MYLLDYTEAITWSKKAQCCFKAGSRNQGVSLQQELLMNIYERNISEAEKILEEILKNEKNNKSIFERNTLLFYKAIIWLEKEQFQKALDIIEDSEEITKDTIGWAFWTRIMTIYLNILLENDDVAFKCILNLKKQIQRISKHKEFRERDMLVFKVLMELGKKGFSTYEVYPKVNMLLAKLKEPKNHWVPFSSELIPFEQLLKKKFKKY